MKNFIGRWKLMSVLAKCGDKVLQPFSSKPHGTIIYSNDYVVVFISNGKRSKFLDMNNISDEEILTNFYNFESYCGSYSININDNIVTHHLEHSKIPNAIGTDFRRYYKFTNNNNILSLKTIDPIHINNNTPIKNKKWCFYLEWAKIV